MFAGKYIKTAQTAFHTQTNGGIVYMLRWIK